MTIELLKQIGLTNSQAKTYLALVDAGSLTPPQLARVIGEGRTTAYMALAKLEELGLAIPSGDAKTKTYEPASPSVLSNVIDKKRQELDSVDETFRNSLSEMLSTYFAKRAKPGVKFYQGMDGLREIYKDHLETGEYVKVLRTPADEEFGQVLYDYMDERAARDIKSEILGPAIPGVVQFSNENNERLKRVNHWCPIDAYNAPVEISIYGNKVSMISFGEEAIGVIIESPQIAQSLSQLYEMAKVGAKSLSERDA